MEIILAKSAGFCFGVNRAVEKVYSELENSKVYTYGPIIHNKEVTKDLEEKGVAVINSLDEIKEKRAVVIRSHGVPKVICDELKEKNIDYIDCTCPFVKKIHNIVKKAYEVGNKVIIVGDKTHPEVIGINGWCNNSAIITDDIEEIEKLKLDNLSKYILVVQTTFSKDKFEKIQEIIKKYFNNVEINNTICNATSDRQKETIEISKKADIMIVIGDKKSSNTQKLYEISKNFCKKTYYIETIKDLQLNIFETNDKIVVGITAGASTPPAIIKEAIKIMEEMNFEQMLEESFVTLHTGDIVKGTVIQVTNEEVSVNLGYKSDGIIQRGEFSEDPNLKPSETVKPGDEIEVFVIRVNDGEGNVLLSRKRVESQKGMSEIENAFENKTTLKGKFTEVVKNGMIATINGVRVFVPSSQISNKYVENLKDFIGKEYDFNIIEFIKGRRGKLIAGRRDIAEKEAAAKKKEIFDKFNIGDKVKGTVSHLESFGAFIDLGGIDGLAHISELSWNRVTKPQNVLKEGQQVEATIIDLDAEKGKISLSLKDPDKNPWTLTKEKIAVGDIVEGKVVRMVPFGAFVALETGIDGLVHISQISQKRIAKPEDVLEIGQVIKVKVMEINDETKKISLSKKEADGIEAAEEAQSEE